MNYQYIAINKNQHIVQFWEGILKMSVYVEKNRKTKKLIQNAFIELLREKPFDNITVGHIAKQANINRGTFYIHYLDKYDLLDKIENQLFEDLGNQIDLLQANTTPATTFEADQQQLANALFQSIKFHEPLLKIFLGQHGRAGFHFRFRDAFSKKVRKNLEQHILKKKSLLSFDYFLAFITSAFLGLIEQWIQNDLVQSPEEMTNVYMDIIKYIQNGAK